MKQINKKQDYLIIRGCILHNEELSIPEVLLLSKLVELWINCETVQVSNKKLSEMLRLSKRTIINSNNRLKELGLIETLDSYNGEGSRVSNTYILNEKRINEFLCTELFEIANEEDKKHSNLVEENSSSKSEIVATIGNVRLGKFKGKFYAVKDDGSFKKLNNMQDYLKEFGSNGSEVYKDCIIKKIYG